MTITAELWWPDLAEVTFRPALWRRLLLREDTQLLFAVRRPSGWHWDGSGTAVGSPSPTGACSRSCASPSMRPTARAWCGNEPRHGATTRSTSSARIEPPRRRGTALTARSLRVTTAAATPRWSRPAPFDGSGRPIPWCIVDQVTNGCVHTACLGRWSATEPAMQSCDIPPVEERCGGCVNASELEIEVGIDVTAELFGDVDAAIAGTFGEEIAEQLANEAIELEEPTVRVPRRPAIDLALEMADIEEPAR